MDQDLDVTGVDQDDGEDISLTEKWFSIDQLLFYARNMNKGIEIEAFELKKGDGERTAWKSLASFGTSGQNHELLAINRVVDYSVGLKLTYVLYRESQLDVDGDDTFLYTLAYVDFDEISEDLSQGSTRGRNYLCDVINFKLNNTDLYRAVHIADGPNVLFCNLVDERFCVASYLGGVFQPVFCEFDSEVSFECEDIVAVYNLPTPDGFQKFVTVSGENEEVHMLSLCRSKENSRKIQQDSKLSFMSTKLLSPQEITKNLKKKPAKGSTVYIQPENSHWHKRYVRIPDGNFDEFSSMVIYNPPGDFDPKSTKRSAIVAFKSGILQEFSSGDRLRTRQIDVVASHMMYVNGNLVVTGHSVV